MGHSADAGPTIHRQFLIAEDRCELSDATIEHDLFRDAGVETITDRRQDPETFTAKEPALG
jgi:hypothetical protein